MAGFPSRMSSRQAASYQSGSHQAPLRRGDAEAAADASGEGRMPWQRRAGERAAAARRDGAPDGSFGIAEDHVTRSVRAVERAVENFLALRENCDHYKDVAADLRRALDDEQGHSKATAEQLADAERAAKADRERAVRAEDRLEQSAQTNRELERQLATVRAQTERLVQTISRLIAAESRAKGKNLSLDELLAA